MGFKGGTSSPIVFFPQKIFTSLYLGHRQNGSLIYKWMKFTVGPSEFLHILLFVDKLCKLLTFLFLSHIDLSVLCFTKDGFSMSLYFNALSMYLLNIAMHKFFNALLSRLCPGKSIFGNK